MTAEAPAVEPSLAEDYDAALVDLDGVVYSGDQAVPGAVEALAAARQRGMARVFVTNNASRTPGTVADHLQRLGVPAGAGDVVTSAQAAATALARRLPRGAQVLVVGGDGLVEALREQGLRTVRSAEAGPVAVVQGFSPDTTWRMLMEACVAVRGGLPWVATNVDATFPTPRGEGPGNGALVDVVRHVTGREPDSVAGKPCAPIMDEARRRAGAARPLVVGDRLDTDIEAAHAAGMDSLLVLTGVTGVSALLECPPQRRPTFVGADLTALLRPGHRAEARDGWWVCGVASVRLEPPQDGSVRLEVLVHGVPTRGCPSEHSASDVADVLHAAAAACWAVLAEDGAGAPAPDGPGRHQAAVAGWSAPGGVVAEVRRALTSWAAPHGWDR